MRKIKREVSLIGLEKPVTAALDRWTWEIDLHTYLRVAVWIGPEIIRRFSSESAAIHLLF